MATAMMPNEKGFTLKKDNKYRNPNLINKANEIIASYKELSKNKEWKEAKEKELVLHFLHTFHRYNDPGLLKDFKSANDIRAFDFGEAFATREAIWGIYRRLAEQYKVMEIANDITTNMGKEVANIRGLLLETQDVKNQFRDVQNKIMEMENSADKMREFINDSVTNLNNRIGLIRSPDSDINNLSSRLATLESKISSLGSGSSSSSGGGVPMSKVNQLGDKVSTINSAISNLIDTLNNKGDIASAITRLKNTFEELRTTYNAL
ncbi:9862_t:CDS:2 [Entrophospora sp. SA101]|nr:9862_t:CDS:2 [Entrophospora sp. SA101]